MLTAKDFHGLWAIIPTPSKPGADRADAVDTVDLDETARVVDALIRDGSDALDRARHDRRVRDAHAPRIRSVRRYGARDGEEAHPVLHRHDGARHARSRVPHALRARSRRRRHSARLADVAAAHRRHGGGILSQRRRTVPEARDPSLRQPARVPVRVSARVLGRGREGRSEHHVGEVFAPEGAARIASRIER